MALSIGRFTVSFVNDGGVGPFPAEHVIGDEQLAAKIGSYESGMVVPVLVDGDDVVVVDAGYGPASGGGGIIAGLKDLGLTPEDVTAVLITHLHGDHASGLVTGDQPTFPNARVHVAKADVDWIRAQKNPLAAFLDILAGADLLAALDDLPDGVEAVDAPGHTPGHTVFRAVGDGQSLLVGGDTLIVVEQVSDPTITVKFDADPDLAIATRKRILDLAASTNALVSFYHLTPDVGRVETGDGAWRWVGA